MAGKKISELPNQTGIVNNNDLFVMVDVSDDSTRRLTFSGLIANTTGVVVTEVSGELDQINSDISTLSGRIDGNDSDIQDLQTATGNLENRSDSLDSQISALETTTTDLFNSGVALENSTGALSTATGILETRVSDLETSTGFLSTATGNLDSDLSQIETNINNLQSSGTTFEQQTGNLDASIQILQTATGNLDSDISILEGLTGGFLSTGNALETATGEIAAITGSLDTYIQSQTFADDVDQIIQGAEILTETGTSFNMTSGMINKYVRCTNSGDITITINSGLGFLPGNSVEFVATQSSFDIAGSGVNLNYIGGEFEFLSAAVKNITGEEYDIIGGSNV